VRLLGGIVGLRAADLSSLALSALSATLTLAAFLFFFIVRVHPDLLVGGLGDVHKPPLLSLCHHRLIDKPGCWPLQHFLIGGVWLPDGDGSLDGNGSGYRDITVLGNGLISVTWGPKVNMTIVATFSSFASFALAASKATTLALASTSAIYRCWWMIW